MFTPLLLEHVQATQDNSVN